MWSYSDLAYLSFRTALLEELNGPAFEKKKKSGALLWFKQEQPLLLLLFFLESCQNVCACVPDSCRHFPSLSSWQLDARYHPLGKAFCQF